MDTIFFKDCFTFNSIVYGWSNGNLYRIPQDISGRKYPIKMLKSMTVGCKKGFLLNGKRKSLRQIDSFKKEGTRSVVIF